MEQRTCNIIMICKRGYNGMQHYYSPLEMVMHYIADECGCERTDYSFRDTTVIIKEAVLDFINTCDQKRVFLADYFERVKWDESDSALNAWLSAFHLVQLREADPNDPNAPYHYINGFTEEQVNKALEICEKGVKY